MKNLEPAGVSSVNWISFCLVFSVISASHLALASKNELVVYSARKEHLVKPLFEAYQAKTGTKIKYVTDKAAALMEKMKAEGKRSQADVLFTVDAGNLWAASEAELLSPLNSPILSQNIPANLRDPENRWYGLSVRAKNHRIQPRAGESIRLKRLRRLGVVEVEGRLCLRTSKKVYNQSLVAMFLSTYGEKKTETMVKSWVANLATKVFPNDTALLKAIAAGQCDVGIVNSYYFGRLQQKNPEFKAKLFWPLAENGRHSREHIGCRREQVLQKQGRGSEVSGVVEWFGSSKMFAKLNFEFAANKLVKPSKLVESWETLHQVRLTCRVQGSCKRRPLNSWIDRDIVEALPSATVVATVATL